MSDLLPPDAEKLLVNFTLDEFGDELDDHVYTELPGSKSFPAVRIHQFYDEQASGPALWLMRYRLQVDVWGGSKNETRLLADSIRRSLVHDLPGTHDEGVVTNVEVRGLDTTADNAVPTDNGRPRPRCRFDVDVWAHAAALVGS